MLIGSNVITCIQTGQEVTHIIDHITILIDIDRVEVKLEAAIVGTLFTGKQVELIVELDTDTCPVDGGREVVYHIVSVVRAVETLAVTVRKPVVDISFRFDAELVHIEVTFLKSILEMSVKTSLHIQV